MNLATVRAAVSRHPRVRALAGAGVDRLVAVVPGPPPGLRGAPSGVAEGDVVTVVVVLLSTDGEAVRRSLEDLAEVARRHGSLRVVMAVDGQHLPLVRRAGVLAEHLVGGASWAARDNGQEWGDYLRGRLDDVRRDLGAEHVLVLPPGGTTGLDPDLLLAALPRPPRGRLRRAWRSGVLRLERALDAPTG